jgi:hypothetical protein
MLNGFYSLLSFVDLNATKVYYFCTILKILTYGNSAFEN